MMTWCKEKGVLVAVYEEKPKPKRRRSTRNNINIKHNHHHHHYHLHVNQIKDSEGNNRRAELLSYSKRLRESSKLKPPPHHKCLVASSTNNNQQTSSQVLHLQTKQELKKKSSWLDMNNIFKCFAMSHAKRKMKKKKKKTGESSAKKASVMMKKFNARTQKGARRFFKKLMATIQKYR